MGVCSMWILMVLCILSTLHSVDTSVNTCRLPNVKNTTQSSDHGSKKYLSYRAVDGCTKQNFSEPFCCSHTAAGKEEAWWQVDLEGPTVVDYVKIYYRAEGYQQKQRFVGYQLYVSNTSNWRDGYRCFADETSNGNKLSLTPKIRCNGIAEYLTIYSDRRSNRRKSWYSYDAILELCEVEVYGCPLGKYGNGTCDEDCATGCASSVCDPVTGKCASCTPGYYGNHCDQNCPANCKDNRCIQRNGTCEDCEDGFFGSSCGDCSVGCTDRVCHKKSGECSPCNAGYYGSRCDQTCPFKCKDNRCEQNDGDCKDCEDGFYGLSCDDCSVGCTNLACDKKSGNCSQCKPGYFGDFCNITCPSNCEEDVCKQTSGICTDCKPGYYGDFCNLSCPSNCEEGVCNQTSGICTACASGYFGLDCGQECGQCSDVSCRRTDGLCLCTGMTHGTCGCQFGWEGTNCTTKKEMTLSDNTETQSGVGVAVGVAVGVSFAIVAVIAIVLFVIYRRKLSSKHKDNQRKGSSSNKPMGNVQSLPIPLDTPNQQRDSRDIANDRQMYVNVHNIDHNTDDESVYNNADVTGVPIHELRSIIDTKMENKAEAFQVEFKTFPWGAVRPHEAGKKASNKQRNRFKTIFPYDHSRVVLETNGKNVDMTYINANYIDGIGNENAYIASQGPKPNTLDDFWKMVWQQNSGKIVMLTNLYEGRNVKCHKYWPDEGESLVTETFELKLVRERTYAFYVIRDISITLKKTKEERQVHQFHFTAWPDHGTPDTLELLLFDRRVTSFNTPLTGQMIVHCSAGIGRTGTFIGLDALLTYGKKTGKVDIPRYIRTMRSGRMNMIQTYEQYIALHELLVEGCTLQDSLIFRVHFPAVLAMMCPTDVPANQTRIHQEFKVLKALTPSYSRSCFIAALLAENMKKNRNKDILAADKYRPFLQPHLPNMTDYINAVMIQSHTSMSGYLITQFPLVNTIDDFWTMVLDYSCANIVVLGKPAEVEDWLREEDGYFAGGNSISLKKLQDRSQNTELTIADYQVESGRSHSDTIRIFSMPQWSSDSLLPPTASSLLHLLEQLDSRRRSDNTRPVVVMCRDGCKQSGLFCCISNARDQMKMDEEVDIFQTARRLKQRRPEALDNITQYQYCYSLLGQYLDSTDVYIN